jgi:hypothetical protein
MNWERYGYGLIWYLPGGTAENYEKPVRIDVSGPKSEARPFQI